MTWERRCAWALALGGVVALASIAWAQYAIGTSAPWVYDVGTAPQRPVGLVLGCSEKLPGGRQNLYFTYRIQRAAELYRQGKVGHLLVSGDNSRKDYDEPTAMRDALVA